MVEDHPLNTEIAMRILNKKGIVVEHVENGEKALEFFCNSRLNYYDAILMDIQMPVMDGYEAARNIRSMERKDSVSIPIIAMTANAFTDDIIKAKEAGMNEHLAKPINSDQMFRILHNQIIKSIFYA